MNGRSSNSYAVPSVFFTGIAVSQLFSTISLLLQIKNRDTRLWKLSSFALGILFFNSILVLITLDFLAFPYSSLFSHEINVASYLGSLYSLLYFFNFMSTMCMVTLFILRIKIFYGRKSTFYKFLVAIGIIAVIMKGAGDVLGLITVQAYMSGSFASPTLHPLYPYIPAVVASATLLEGLFSAIGSISFLYFLTDFHNTGDWRALRRKVMQSEGSRLLLIVAVHFLIVALGFWLVVDDNNISHVAFYLPGLAYALEIHAFVTISYNSARRILANVHLEIHRNDQRVSANVALSPTDTLVYPSNSFLRK